MSARLVVVSGVCSGRSYRVSRSVVRIGSHPDTDVCLPIADLASHAVTLEFRDGTYRVYNRGEQPMVVNGHRVGAEGNAIWSDGEELQLPGDTRLLLETSGDGAPGAPTSELLYEPPETGEGPEEADGATAQRPQEYPTPSGLSPKDLVQLGIIIICFLGIGGILALKFFSPEFTGAEAEVPEFYTVVTTGLSEFESTGDVDLKSVLTRLQQAEAARVRGDAELARLRYSRLRDTLVRRQRVDLSFPADAEESIYRYVRHQLQQLSEG